MLPLKQILHLQRLIQDLAFAYWNRYYYETYFEKNYLDSCLILAEKALSYDDQLDEAYFIKGEYYRVNGQHDEALLNYDKALEINPNYYSGILLERISSYLGIG